jgi:hypothetical protein
MAADPTYTDRPVKCPHCGHNEVAIQLKRYNRVESHDERGIYWEAGYVYELDACQSCEAPILRRGFHHSEAPEEFEWEFLYPTPPVTTEGLPDRVETAFKAALRVREIDGNAFGVLLGRVLEAVCHDRKAKGRTLADKLTTLAKQGDIPPHLAELAQSLREFRNVGAHFTLGDLSVGEVPFLEQLCRAVLQYVYEAPLMIDKAQSRLDDLKKRQKIQ